MKLAKLSLAAIVAAGALASTASAASLEEAIKDVEVKGFVRYRFYNYDPQGADNNDERHRFSVPITFVAPAGDNLTVGVTVRSEQNERDDGDDEAVINPSSDPDLNMVKAWFKYATKDFSVRAGKFEVNTPWTDPGYGGTRGTGALAMYTGVPGWAFAGAGFTHVNDIGEENLYAAAAIGALGPVNAQVWYAKATNVFDSSIFAQVDGKMGGLSLKAQMNNLEIDGGDDGIFYGVEAGFKMDNISVGAGYTQNDDDQPVYTLTADDAGMIKAGKQIYYKTTNALDAETMFIKGGVGFGAASVGAGYIDASEKSTDANGHDWSEFYIDAGYKYSKNTKFSAYYSMLDGDNDTGENEIRFEAKYSF